VDVVYKRLAVSYWRHYLINKFGFFKSGNWHLAGKKRMPPPWVKYGVRSPKYIWALCAQLFCYSLAEAPHPPPLAYGLIYEGAIGQPR
jgi:hypothetical protein